MQVFLILFVMLLLIMIDAFVVVVGLNLQIKKEI